MSRSPSLGVGERIVNFCIGALLCAICLTLAVDMLKSRWAWLAAGALAVLAIGAVARWLVARRSPW